MAEYDIIYRVMTAADEDEVRYIMKTCLFTEEQNLRSRRCEWPSESRLWVDPTVSDSISGGVTIVALDEKTNKIVGLRLSVITSRNDSRTPVYPDKHKFSSMTRAKQISYEGINIFERYNVDTMICFRGLCVIDGYKRRGIATKMVEKCLDIIAEKRISCVVQAEVSSSYTRLIFNKLGFENLRELNYKDLIVDGKPYLTAPPEHPSWSAHVKEMKI